MSAFMQFIEATFKPMVLIFTVSNLFVMGLQAKMPLVIAVFKNKKAIALIFVWGWVLGPAVGYLITWALPLAEPYVVVVLLSSLAPCAPFLPPLVEKAHAVDGTSVDQGADGQRWRSRKGAPADHTPAAGHRSGNPALGGDYGD
jgi:hypothetical protein